MPVHSNEIERLAEEFAACRNVLLALGDENRQHLIMEMMRMGSCSGVRVGDITVRTHLSRPAVSHHIRILKEAGILKVRRDGTKNYYYFDVDAGVMDKLIRMAAHTKTIMETMPNRGGNDDRGGT